MKIAGLSPRVLRFEGAHSNAPSLVGESLIRTIELDGHLRIMIEVGERTKATELKELIPIALQWRDWLLAEQGPWIKGGRGRYLLQLETMNHEGVSYAELAKRINRSFVRRLVEHLAYEHSKESPLPAPKPSDADEFWPNPYALTFVSDTLVDFGLLPGEAEDVINDGLQRLRNGRSAFMDDEYPITRQRMIDVLRGWRRATRHRLRGGVYGPAAKDWAR